MVLESTYEYKVINQVAIGLGVQVNPLLGNYILKYKKITLVLLKKCGNIACYQNGKRTLITNDFQILAEWIALSIN